MQKLAHNKHWAKVKDFYVAQIKEEIQMKRRTLKSIQAMEADKQADLNGSTRPSEMTEFEISRSRFIKNLTGKQAALAAIFGFETRMSKGEEIHPQIERASLNVPRTTVVFSSFGMSVCLASAIGQIPSFLPLVVGASSALLFRAAWVALKVSKDATEPPAFSPHYFFTPYEAKNLATASLACGFGLLASTVPWWSLPIIPAMALVNAYFPSNVTHAMLWSVGAPLGILTGPYLDQVSVSYLLQLQGLMWLGSASAFSVFKDRNPSTLFAGISSSTIWLTALGLAGMHRTFFVLGAPTTAAFIAQAAANKFYKDNPSVDQPDDESMSRRHMAYSVGMLGTFIFARAYSNTQGFINRAPMTVLGYGDDEVDSKVDI